MYSSRNGQYSSAVACARHTVHSSSHTAPPLAVYTSLLTLAEGVVVLNGVHQASSGMCNRHCAITHRIQLVETTRLKPAGHTFNISNSPYCCQREDGVERWLTNRHTPHVTIEVCLVSCVTHGPACLTGLCKPRQANCCTRHTAARSARVVLKTPASRS